MNPVIYVRFNDPAEFLDELAKNPPNVEPIVRVTMQFRSSGITPNIRHLHILGGYLRRADGDVLLLVQLERFCGDIWNSPNQDQPILNNAKQVIELLSAEISKHGVLSVNAGSYDPVNP